MYIGKRWLIALLLLLVLGAGGYFFFYNAQVQAQEGSTNRRGLFSRNTTTNSNSSSTTATVSSTVTIQPASALVSEVSAAGHIDLVNQQLVAPDVSGVVNQVNVKVGAQVKRGAVLLALDTIALERAVKRAELTVDSQRNNLAKLTEPADAAELALAEANLAKAQENLADVEAGPSNAEIAAARASLSSSWSKYNELKAGPSQDELTQLSASLKKAEVALAEARRAYDKVAWRNDIGMTSQAADLQSATIDYESAKAAYAETIASASTSCGESNSA